MDFCWIIVPSAYFHYHPVKPWPGADYRAPIWWTLLFWIVLFAALGFLQLRMIRQFEGKFAKILFWLFLGLSSLWLIDNWIFSL